MPLLVRFVQQTFVESIIRVKYILCRWIVLHILVKMIYEEEKIANVKYEFNEGYVFSDNSVRFI